MYDEKMIVDENIREIHYRYNVKDGKETNYFFYEALEEQDVREKIYDKVYELIGRQ